MYGLRISQMLAQYQIFGQHLRNKCMRKDCSLIQFQTQTVREDKIQ